MSEQEVLPTEEIIEKVLPEKEKEEDLEDLKKRSRKPPENNKCKICGQYKPLNRLKLCYECWVLEELKKDGWSGGPHPNSCGCTGLGGHEARHSEGN